MLRLPSRDVFDFLLDPPCRSMCGRLVSDAVRVFFGSRARVRFFRAAAWAFSMFLRAAARCFALAGACPPPAYW